MKYVMMILGMLLVSNDVNSAVLSVVLIVLGLLMFAGGLLSALGEEDRA